MRAVRRSDSVGLCVARDVMCRPVHGSKVVLAVLRSKLHCPRACFSLCCPVRFGSEPNGALSGQRSRTGEMRFGSSETCVSRSTLLPHDGIKV